MEDRRCLLIVTNIGDDIEMNNKEFYEDIKKIILSKKYEGVIFKGNYKPSKILIDFVKERSTKYSTNALMDCLLLHHIGESIRLATYYGKSEEVDIDIAGAYIDKNIIALAYNLQLKFPTSNISILKNYVLGTDIEKSDTAIKALSNSGFNII